MSLTPVWEEVPGNFTMERTRTPTGWLVRVINECAHLGVNQNEYVSTGYDWRVSITFVPDPDGVWLKG